MPGVVSSLGLEVEPGYCAIAWAGVAPLITASVLAITRLVVLGAMAAVPALDSLAAAPSAPAGEAPVVLNNFALQPEAGLIAYLMQALPTVSVRRKCPSAS